MVFLNPYVSRVKKKDLSIFAKDSPPILPPSKKEEVSTSDMNHLKSILTRGTPRNTSLGGGKWTPANAEESAQKSPA